MSLMIEEFNTHNNFSAKCDLAQKMVDLGYPNSLINYAISALVRRRNDNFWESSRITCYTHNLNFEGAPLALLNHINASNCNDFVDFVSPKDGPLANKLYNHSYNVIIDSSIFQYNPRPHNFDNLLARIKVHLISTNASKHFINTTRGWLIALACQQLGFEYIWWIHEAEEPFCFISSPNIKNKAMRLLLTSLEVKFASLATMQRYSMYINQKSIGSVLYPRSIKKEFIDLVYASDQELEDIKFSITKFLGINMPAKIILNVGSICSRKNQLELIQGFVDATKRNIGSNYLLFIGDQTSETSYMEEITKYIDTNVSSFVKEKIIFIDPTDQIHRFYAASDLYIHSSYFECYSQAVNEAKCLGKKILARDCEGMNEVLSGYSNASLYKDKAELTRWIELHVND